MSYTYKDENGQEIIIHDLKESKELREKYHFPNNGESTYTNEHNNINDNKTSKKIFNKQTKKGCLGCLTNIIYWVLAITLIHQGIKEVSKDHVDEYCNIDKYFENHQENEMEDELGKKTYYVHQKLESDILSQEDYEKIKSSLSTSSIIETIELEGVKKVKVTNTVRILSRKKKIQDFQRVGKYTFSKDDNIFIFAKDYNTEGEARDIKIVSFEYFDTYIQQGYNFIGIASLDSYKDTEFKTQYSMVLDEQDYSYSDADKNESVYSKNKK